MEIEGNNINNRLELIKGLTDVKSEISKNISQDFVLSKLNDQQKEGTIEMVNNAYLMKKILTVLKEKKKKWEWDKKKKVWYKRDLNESELFKCDEIIKNLFESIMIRITMMQVLNRNVPSNYLVRIVSGLDEAEIDIPKEKELDTGKKLKETSKKIISPQQEGIQ